MQLFHKTVAKYMYLFQTCAVQIKKYIINNKRKCMPHLSLHVSTLISMLGSILYPVVFPKANRHLQPLIFT